ncbi:MAG: DUF4124 domain-containing protein [Sinobacteraceae bacterium]|nr:DUF4124 domain-containing protein [Nevskiaceae bacterium]
MRNGLFTLLLLAAAVHAGPIYKWVDDNGVTHFSDQPNAGAQKIKVQEAQSYTPPAAPAPAAPGSVPPAGGGQPVGIACAIESPTDDQVIFNTFTVSGRLRINPEPRGNRQVVMLLDGKQMPGVASGNSFTITPVDRGTHTLGFEVLDSTGQVLCQAPNVTFHVRQPSTQAPFPANRPKF